MIIIVNSCYPCYLEVGQEFFCWQGILFNTDEAPFVSSRVDSGEENAFHVYNNYKLEQSEVSPTNTVLD